MANGNVGRERNPSTATTEATAATEATEEADRATGPLDELLCEVLGNARTIAVVGMKEAPDEDAYRVPSYMREHGYDIVPVNPKLENVSGLKAYRDLLGVSEAGLTVDLVNLFRASEHIDAHVDEILQMQPVPRAVWMQLGIHHGPSAKRLREAGVAVVQDRCIMVDHRRLAPRFEAQAATATDS